MVALTRQFSNTQLPERNNRRKLVLDRQDLSDIERLLRENRTEE
jgi:hypothetical protein